MYEFNKQRHVHTLDGKPLTGVTTVLGVVSKGDGLIQWSANEASRYVKETVEAKFYINDDVIPYKDLMEIVEDSKTAWKNTRDTAGTSGTTTHEIIEGIIKRAIVGDGYVTPSEAHEYNDNPQVKQFIEWAHKNVIKFLESEKNVYSTELWIGGIVDFVFEKDGEVYVGDVKTAKSIYPTNFWQTSAYQYCLQEMGMYPKIKGFCIVRLGKDGSFETKENYSYEDNIEGFKGALTIYRKLNAITPPKRVYKTKKDKIRAFIRDVDLIIKQ